MKPLGLFSLLSICAAASAITPVWAALTSTSSLPISNEILELGGVPAAALRSVVGGDPEAPVNVVQAGAGVQVKSLGTLRYGDLALELGVPINRTLADWMANSWKGTRAQVSGAIAQVDALGKVRGREDFTGIVCETTIPAMDVSSGKAAAITISIRPSSTRWRPDTASTKIPAKTPYQWLASQFRLELDGVDCKYVRRVEAFSIKIGDGGVVFPDLHVTLGPQGWASWSKWFDSSVQKGVEVQGNLKLIAYDGRQELCNIRLNRVALSALRTHDKDAISNPERPLTAVLYCESMQLEWTPSLLAP